MRQHSEIIGELKEIANTPKEQVKEFKERTGKKAVGCFPVYTPGELVYAAGMLPIGMWGAQVEINKAKSYVPAFCCSIMQSNLELGLQGSYDDLSAVIIPSMCDTLKCVAQNFKVGVPHIHFIQFTHPQMRKIDAGVDFLMSEYKRVINALEAVSGETVTEDALADAINVFNSNRRALRRFVEVARNHSNIVTAPVRHAAIKAGYFIEKPKHTKLLNELCDALEKTPTVKAEKSILLSGILAEPSSFLDLFAANNIAVLSDDLAQETRQFRTDVPTKSSDPLRNLAEWCRDFEGCSLAYDPDKKRIDMIIDDVKEHNIDGVVICMMKFCDPEEYDYPLIKSALEENNIPELYIEIDQQSDINMQASTRIQAFSEIL